MSEKPMDEVVENFKELIDADFFVDNPNSSDIRETLNEVLQSYDSLQSQLAEIKSDLSKKDKELTELEAQLAEAQAENLRLKDIALRNIAMQQTALKERDDARDGVEIALKSVTDIHTDKLNLLSERDALKAEVEKLNVMVNHGINECTKLTRENEELVKQNKSLNHYSNKAESERDTLNAQLAEMRASRDAYARAMEIALRDGIFANKAATKRAIEEVLKDAK